MRLNTPKRPVTQKSFDTSSAAVDLLHRMENLVEIGSHAFQGQKEPVELLLLASDLVQAKDLEIQRQSA